MTWTGRGSTRAWRKLRATILERDPYCRLQYPGCTHISQHADHIVNVATAPHLEYDPANIQGVCPSCHEVKTKREAQAGREHRNGKRKPVRYPGLLP